MTIRYLFALAAFVLVGAQSSILPSFSPDGGTVDKTYEFAVESRKTTVRTDRPIPVVQVRDLTLLREVQRELRLH